MPELTKEKILSLEIGETLCDMHEKLPQIPEGLKIKIFYQWDSSNHSGPHSNGQNFIATQTGKRYTNKLLTLVDIKLNGDRVFNYSYDQKYFGVVVIGE